MNEKGGECWSPSVCRLPSDCHSEFHRVVIGLPSECHRSAIGVPSECHRSAIGVPARLVRCLHRSALAARLVARRGEQAVHARGLCEVGLLGVVQRELGGAALSLRVGEGVVQFLPVDELLEGEGGRGERARRGEGGGERAEGRDLLH